MATCALGKAEIIIGQVVHVRRVSRALLFFDMILRSDDDMSSQSNTPKRVCVMCKKGALTQHQVRECRSCVRLGDTVAVSGSYESATALDDHTAGDTMAAQGSGVFVAGVVPAVVLALPAGSHFEPIPPPSLKSTADQKDQTSITPAPNGVPEGWCKSWFYSSSCSVRDTCRFEHPAITKELKRRRQQAILDKRAKRRRVAVGHSVEQSGGAADVDSRTHEERFEVAPKRLRATVFAGWLIKSFGLDDLRAGHVLDVAGGRGGLSFELHCVHGVPTVLLEPRPFKLTKAQRRVLKSQGNPALPQQVQARMCAEDLDEIEGAWSIVRKCKIVAAMHPDQATEPAVDYAIQNQLPFAVVPCCVCWRDAPERLSADGSPVTSYDDFLDYLQNKRVPTGTIHREQLGFVGRNTVLYWKP